MIYQVYLLKIFRYAAFDLVVPAALWREHWYQAWSWMMVSSMTRVGSSGTIPSMAMMGASFLNQRYLGFGSPVALHSRMAVPPKEADVFFGWSMTVGFSV